MPGVWVFAGGVVEEADREATGGATGDVDPDELAHRVCGARELAEEAGVEIDAETLAALVALDHPRAGPGPLRHPLLRGPGARPLQAGARRRRDGRRPLGRPRRRPAGQQAQDEFELSFPTIKHLEELRGFADADAVLANAAGRPRRPADRRASSAPRSRSRSSCPGEPGYEDALGAPAGCSPGDLPARTLGKRLQARRARARPGRWRGRAPPSPPRTRRKSLPALRQRQLELVAGALPQPPEEVELPLGGAEVDLAVDRRRPVEEAGLNSSRRATGSWSAAAPWRGSAG